MGYVNKVILMGNLTRDPELKQIGSGTSCCELGMAINRTWNDANGTKKEEVTFIDLTCFGKQAEVIAQYKKKGDPLFIEGRLKLDQWEAQDGSKRTKMRVIVESFQFLNRREGNGQDTPTPQPTSQPRKQAKPTSPAGGYQGEPEPVIKGEDIPF